MAKIKLEASAETPILLRDVVRHAIQGTDCPALGELALDDWLEQFVDVESRGWADRLVTACMVADLPHARSLAISLEDSFLRHSPTGKHPSHR